MKRKLLGALILALPLFSLATLCKANTRPSRTYIICDVETNTDTEINAIMPNGEIHTYEAEDLPEEDISLVCFATENQDDYTSYEIVALR